MTRLTGLNKNYLGAALLIAMGAGALALGVTYRIGTLNRMGAGFVPVVLGSLLILVGCAVALTAALPAANSSKPGSTGSPDTLTEMTPEWRGRACILGGIVAFVLLGEHGGLVPATFAAVFIAALGDRQNNLKSAAALAAVIDAFGVLVFHFGLHVQLPLFHWG